MLGAFVCFIENAPHELYYVLLFIPHLFRFVTQGKLVLTNTLDGTEQVYRLLGTGQKPLPLDHIFIECPAKQRSVIYYLTFGPPVIHVFRLPSYVCKLGFVTCKVLWPIILTGHQSLASVSAALPESVFLVFFSFWVTHCDSLRCLFLRCVSLVACLSCSSACFSDLLDLSND